jgi:hypothetical protein
VDGANMTTVLFASGILNFTDPIFGQPFYIYLWLFILILAGICWLAWRFGQWEAFKPLWGIYYAFKAESKACFIFNTNLAMELVSERDAKCIFEYSKWNYELPKNGTPVIGSLFDWFQKKVFSYTTVFLENLDTLHGLFYKVAGRNFDVEIAKKQENYFGWGVASSVNSGGIHIDMILDADRWSVKDSHQHQIVEYAAEQWNSLNENDQIHSYQKFQKYLLEGKIPKPEGIESEVLIPWVRIDSSFPVMVGDNATSGARRQEAIRMENEDATAVSRYYLPVLFGSMGFAILLLLIRVVLKVITASH